MASHFLPLWILLKRTSMLYMAIALGIAAVVGLVARPYAPPIIAVQLFGANSVRLLQGRRSAH